MRSPTFWHFTTYAGSLHHGEWCCSVLFDVSHVMHSVTVLTEFGFGCVLIGWQSNHEAVLLETEMQ